MKIGIYSPYLDTSGGGERYMLTIAEILSQDHDVDVLLDKHLSSMDLDLLKQNLHKKLDINFEKIRFLKAPIGPGSTAVKRALFLKKYDVLFCLTDGSIFYSTAKKSFLHIQSPLTPSNNNLKSKVKLSSWNKIIYNSEFTKLHAQKSWPIKSTVIYPPVNVEDLKPFDKKKYILTVGRFFGHLKEKKHQEMLQAFEKLILDKKIKDWKFILVGSTTEGDKEYVESLKKQSKDLPVEILPNLPYSELIKLYGQASIYWHAMGIGETDPTKMEHFGITTVEAMAAGCVPVVINKGGQKEVVEEGKSGFLWETLEQLVDQTNKLIGDPKKREQMSKESIKRSQQFSKETFKKRIEELIYAD